MSSVSAAFKQPLTRSFVVTQAADNGEGETGAYYFTQATVNEWIADNSSNLTQVTPSLVIITGNFANTIDNLSDDGVFTIRRSLRDLGEQIVIGNPAESRLLVLRLVQATQSPAFTVGGEVGYIVVESNYRSANWPTPDSSRFNVNVARV